MSKKYDDVKRAAEAAVKGLMRTIYSNLDNEDAETLLLELSMSFFTSTVNFNLPMDKFEKELNNKNINYQLNLLKTITSVKIKIDEGKDDFETI